MSVTELYQALEFFNELIPSDKPMYESERREALFEAASIAFRLLVIPTEERYQPLTAKKKSHIEETSLEKVKNCAFAKNLIQHRESRPPSVVGFHVVDPEIGRYSQIWIPPSRPCPQSNITNNNWWDTYPMLWLRIYKQLLHPSTSLINAFERELFLFPDTRFLVHWNSDKEEEFASDTKIVSLRQDDSALLNFLDKTKYMLNCQFNEILLKHSSELTSKDESKIQEVIDKIAHELKQQNIIDALKDIRDEYLLNVIKPGDSQEKFMGILKDIGSPKGNIYSQLNDYRGKDWYGETRKKAMEGIEVLQTILFNAPGFCNDLGLFVERRLFDNSPVYLLLGRDKGYKLNQIRYSEVREMFSQIANAFSLLLSKRNYIKQPKILKSENNLTVKEILKILKKEDRKLPKGIDGFLNFALELSVEAIHEGHELSFLLGFGHAETPELRCQKPIRLPEHLSVEGVNYKLLVHFVKSHFSLFSREDRVLWFNHNARCLGLYERAQQDPKESWLEGWPNDCYFIRIKGKGLFDILKIDTTGTSKRQHRTRIRVKGDIVVDMESKSDIQYKTIVSAALVFLDSISDSACNPKTIYNYNRVQWVSELIAKVADQLREDAHGAGLVIVNEDKNNEGEWRVPIEKQVKSLVPDLEDFKVEVQFKNKYESPTDNLVNEICLLAKLDGAVFLKFKDTSMCAYPARHFFPLVDINGKGQMLLDFYEWSNEVIKTKGGEVKIEDLRKYLENNLNNIKIANLDKGFKCEHEDNERNLFEKELLDCSSALKPFNNLEILKLYATCIRGLPKQLGDLEIDDAIRIACTDLAFLNSSGTRHHSLWGITLSSKQRLFVVSLSQDGRVSVFWDGRFIPSIKPK